MTYKKLSFERLKQKKAYLEAKLKLVEDELHRRSMVGSASVVFTPAIRDWTLYALECEDKHYYVGCTTNMKKRFKEHLKGKGSWFTAAHKPLAIIEVLPIGNMTDGQAAIEENKLAARYMMKYGVRFVRGGCFIQHDPKYFIHKINTWLEVDHAEAINEELDAEVARLVAAN